MLEVLAEKSVWDSGGTTVVVGIGTMESEITGSYGRRPVELGIADGAKRPLECAVGAGKNGVS